MFYRILWLVLLGIHMMKHKKVSRLNIENIDEAVCFCLSTNSLLITELTQRVTIRSGLPEMKVKRRISQLMHKGFLWMGSDSLIRRLFGEKHLGHKTDLCGVPHNTTWPDLPINLHSPVRCSCCGATFELREYSFIHIDRTMAIPRYYRLICPECP